MKIYIIGPSGSGKTTFARELSNKYNISYYELDCLVYDDNNNHVKRSDKEINKLFNDILKNDSWVIEDVGRNRFIKGRDKCDKIYYLNIPKRIVYIRVIKRWIKQRLGREKYNYPPTLYQFYDMLRVARLYFKHERDKFNSLEKYIDKLVILNYKDLKR